jgi:DNA-binding response OmpR family regulator
VSSIPARRARVQPAASSRLLPVPHLAWRFSFGALQRRSRGRPQPVGRTRVLIVEDDAAIAEMYRLQLELDGFQVGLVSEGSAALAAVRRERPHLVLLDVLLPGLDGFDVLRQLMADPEIASTPVVILSNYGDPSMVRRGRELGARDYLVKSQMTPGELSQRIAGWVDRQRS